MVRVLIYRKSFVCLFVCSFLHFFGKCVTIIVLYQTCQKLILAVEYTSKHGWRDNKLTNSCHIMFSIVYSNFIILNYAFFIEFITFKCMYVCIN